MTVYARSDVMSVSLSKDHGGCGAVHSRPVTHGAPAVQWGLDCPDCEDFLRSDPHWSINLSEVPETPDEERIRADKEKKGQANQSDLLAAAIIAIAQSQQELPDNLAKAIKALTDASLPAEPVVTKGSDDGMQTVPVVIDAPRVVEPEPVEPEPAAVTVETTESDETVDLSKLKVPELRDLATQRGLDSSGMRAELLARLEA